MISTAERNKLHALRDAAANAGDLSQVELCNAALRGSMVALGKCRRAMDEAEAQAAPRKSGKVAKRKAPGRRKRDDC